MTMMFTAKTDGIIIAFFQNRNFQKCTFDDEVIDIKIELLTSRKNQSIVIKEGLKLYLL